MQLHYYAAQTMTKQHRLHYALLIQLVKYKKPANSIELNPC